MTTSDTRSPTPNSTGADAPATTALSDAQLAGVSGGGSILRPQPSTPPLLGAIDGRPVLPPGAPYTGDPNAMITLDR